MISILEKAVRCFWNVVYYFRLMISYLNISAFMYDIILTKPLTRYTYMHLFDNISPNLGNIKTILDVGTGTGHALSSILDKLPQDTKVFGVDIDKHYVQAAQKRFKNKTNVEVKEKNFYEFENSKERFDLIIFSSSFMLMPFRERALDIAKRLLNPKGKIVFLLTLYEKKKQFKLIEIIKPYLKYTTSIDFGNMTYEKDFEHLLEECGLTITKKERIAHKMNIPLKLFRVFYVEANVSSLLSAK